MKTAMTTNIEKIKQILLENSNHGDDGYITDACANAYLADAEFQEAEGNGMRFEISGLNSKSGRPEVFTIK